MTFEARSDDVGRFASCRTLAWLVSSIIPRGWPPLRVPQLRAVIYLRRLNMRSYERCLAWCQQRGYRMVGLVLDLTGDRWPDVLEAAFTGQYDVVVLARLADLPAERVPRMEVAEPVFARAVTPLQRRPSPA